MPELEQSTLTASHDLDQAERQLSVPPPEEPRGETAPQSLPRSYRLKLMLALALPVFLETLDYTVVATAQPHIASAFDRLDLQSWIGTIYVLTSTVFLPIFASLADIFGRHWALQISLLCFTVGCALSTGAQNMVMMLAGRAIAGIGAAGQITVVRTILSDTRSLDANNFQVSTLFVLYSIGFSVGPYIGGVLTSISFRWVFAINLPCAVASMLLCFILLRSLVKGPQPRREKGEDSQEPSEPVTVSEERLIEKIARVDTLGGFFFIAAGILILLALNWGSTGRWNDAKVIATFVVGGLCTIAFVIWEWFAESNERAHDESFMDEKGISKVSWTRPEVMVPLSMFKNYDVCATQFAAFASGMLMLVNFYFVAIYFTIVLGKSPSDAGVQLIYFAPGMGVGTVLAIICIKIWRQPKIPIVLGTGILPIGVGLLSAAVANNAHFPIPGSVAGFLALTGVGVGLTIGPLSIHARFSQSEDRVAIVVALNLFFRTFGGTVGLAQCSAVLYAKVRSFIVNAIVTDRQITAGDAAQLIALGNFNSLNDISNLPPHLQTLVQNAFRDGARWAFISIIPWTAAAAILVLFLSKIPDPDLKDRTRSSSSGNSKPQIYGPITLMIYLYKKRRAKKAAERERAVLVAND